MVLDAALLSKDTWIKIHEGEEDLEALQLHNEATACSSTLPGSFVAVAPTRHRPGFLWLSLPLPLRPDWSCCEEEIFSEDDVFQSLTSGLVTTNGFEKVLSFYLDQHQSLPVYESHDLLALNRISHRLKWSHLPLRAGHL